MWKIFLHVNFLSLENTVCLPLQLFFFSWHTKTKMGFERCTLLNISRKTSYPFFFCPINVKKTDLNVNIAGLLKASIED